MNLIKKTTLLLALSFLFVSMQAQKLQQYIPKDATFVMSMNLANLNNKISFEKLQQYDFYKESMKEMEKEIARDDEQLAKLMMNPSDAGIDIMSESYMFGKMSEDASVFGFLFTISDKKKFDKFFKEQIMPEAQGVIGKIGKFKTMNADGTTLAWNNDVGMMFGAEPNGSGGVSKETLVATMTKSVINGKKKNSILSNSRYAKVTTKKKADMRVWVDYDWVIDMQMKNQDPMMAGVSETMKKLYKDTDYMMELNFNDGAMVLDSKMFSNNETLDRMRKMSTGELNKNFYKYLPKDNLLGYFSMALETESFADAMFEMFGPMLKDMDMNRTQMEDMALQTLNGVGLELDRKGLYEMVKGDMVFAVTGMREFSVMKTQYDEDFNKIEVEAKQKLPEFTMMMSYGKETEVMKLVNMAAGMGMLTKVGESNSYKVAVPIPDVPMDMYLSMKDGILFFTNNDQLAGGKMADGYSKANRMTKDQQKLMKESTGAIFWDIPQSLAAAAEYARSEGMMDSTTDKMLNVSKQSLESIIMKSDKEVKNSHNSQFSFNFVNKRMNSLDQLFSYFNEMYLTAMSSGSM